MNVLTVFLGDMIRYYFSVQWFKLKEITYSDMTKANFGALSTP